MSLPLLQRVAEDSTYFLLTPKSINRAPGAARCRVEGQPSAGHIPQRALLPGEQYRFHFDMGKCIGCKCCVVACNEQNGNPAEINWRRVGEIEGGWYPNTQRLHLSMGCNHCLEPTCLSGCPVNAYSKDPVTGVVLHDPEICIGCQYCTWNCSYGVPQYNPERGVVGKCDMCHNRLAEGREPACVAACPEGAIEIEIVNISQWKSDYARSANAPGLPSADDSISSTRLTLPKNLPPDTQRADLHRVKPEHPHSPLIVMTVLTQLSVGALISVWLLQLFGGTSRLDTAAVLALLVAGLALGASTMHLGRPIHAYRALRMWKRSWLSREVLFFGLFSAVAASYAFSLVLRVSCSAVLGGMTSAIGVAAVTASACIYLVRARPAWNTKHTLVEFYLTGALLGPLLAAGIGIGNRHLLLDTAVLVAFAEILNAGSKFFHMTASSQFELRASATMLSTALARTVLVRSTLLVLGGVVLPLAMPTTKGAWLALTLALGGELLGRYLFFVSVVPKNMASSYLSPKEAAA